MKAVTGNNSIPFLTLVFDHTNFSSCSASQWPTFSATDVCRCPCVTLDINQGLGNLQDLGYYVELHILRIYNQVPVDCCQIVQVGTAL